MDDTAASEKGEAMERMVDEEKLRTKTGLPNTARRSIWARLGAFGQQKACRGRLLRVQDDRGAWRALHRPSINTLELFEFEPGSRRDDAMT